MATPTLITELSTTAAANAPAGSDSPSTLDDIQRAHASFIAQLRDRDSAFALTLLDDANAASARTTLGAAASGANSDITSLLGLTTPLSIAQGGSGSATAFQSSLTTAGYQRLPGGAIIQWGEVAGAVGGTTYSASFPIAFPTACRRVVACSINATGTPTAVSAAVLSASQFNYVVALSGYALSYIAIGH